MFNKSIAFILTTVATAHAEGEVDMTGDAAAATPSATSTAPVAVAGVNSSGAPFAKGTIGFSFPVTLLSNVTSAVSVTTERVPTVDILYFLSEKAAVDLVAGLSVHKTTEYNNATPPMPRDVTNTGFAIGAGYRTYKHRQHVATYVEPLVVLQWDKLSSSATRKVSALGLFGVEAFLTEWASVSGDIGAGVALADGASDIQFSTRANLAANLYWK